MIHVKPLMIYVHYILMICIAMIHVMSLMICMHYT